MTNNINSLSNLEETKIHRTKINNKSSELKETIIPASYIIALAKERKSLKKSKLKTYPSLKDLFAPNVKEPIDPSLINKSLNNLLKGNLYYVQDKEGTLKYLKFIKEDNPIPDLKQKNFINLDKIPIYTITTKDDYLLKIKTFKKRNYIIGYLNFEDAFAGLNEFQQNKTWNPLKKFYNLKEEKTLKISISNLEEFYKMWINTNYKITLIPGSSHFGTHLYITKEPFYISGERKIFLTSFSKNDLKKALNKGKSKNKKIIEIKTNDFFDSFNNSFQERNDYYFFIPNQINYQNVNFSGEDIQNLNNKEIEEISKIENIDLNKLESGSIFLPFRIFNSLGNTIYSNFKTLSEKRAENIEKRKEKRARRKQLRRLYFYSRRYKKIRNTRYFRKLNKPDKYSYQTIYDRDKHFLRSRRLRRLENYNNSLRNNQKKWLRGSVEQKNLKYYPLSRLKIRKSKGVYLGPSKRSKKLNPTTSIILKGVKQRKILPIKQTYISTSRKRKLTPKKVWRLRQLFFRKILVKKNYRPKGKKLLKQTCLKKPNYNPIDKFLQDLKIVELKNKKGLPKNPNSKLVKSFMDKDIDLK